MTNRGARPQTWRQAVTLLALAVLVLRLAIPAPPMPAGARFQDAGFAGSLSDVPICHTDPAPTAPGGKPAAPAHDCALCPVCQLAHAPALIVVEPWLPEPRSAGLASVATLPPSTGPPLPGRYAAPPCRGPPASVV